ncbi:DUF6049 family protein [Haloechinothrix halophila]|uniref:DUF6049 family protein n=1 Tax=Haloechinothrix halophila TaxID=1069073 RepID=UPI0003F58C0D|nr:DUF6049 family protein [Haloechinothrix halophila]
MTRIALALGAAVLLLLLTGMPASVVRAAEPERQHDSSQPPADLTETLRLDVASMTPRIVTTRSRTLAIKVTLTNISERPVDNLRARLHLGSKQTNRGTLTQALTAGAPMDYQLTPFKDVGSRLVPQQQLTFTLKVNLRGGDGGFVFPESGVYPLLINVNGRPEAGLEARLAASHLLLPVLSVPGTNSGEQFSGGPATSILWPIASTPRVVEDRLRDGLVLADDTLAEEMRPGGRLDALVRAAESVRDDDQLFSSLCFAIDPELIATASAMTRGYRVRSGPGTTEGSGSADAEAWLADLRTLVAGGCVVPMPYARADISLLAGSSPDLATLAASRESVINDVLGVKPQDGALAIESELSTQALDAVGEAGKSLLIGAMGGRQAAQPITVTTDESEHTVVPSNELVTLALRPGIARNDTTANATVAADEPAIATQNGLATIAFRARDGGNTPLLIAPPREWSAPHDELIWLLRGIGDLADDGMLVPVKAGALFSANVDGTTRPAQQGSLDPRGSREVTADIAGIEATVEDVMSAMTEATTMQVDPADLLLPVREGLLRATSHALPDQAAVARAAVADADNQLTELLGEVSITEPDRTISLASGSSPIPVSIRNDLPVDIIVRVTLSSTSGLRPDDISDQKLAPESSVNLRVPAEAMRAGRFTVDVSLSTPGGTPLGRPTRFQLASTEYGVVTVIVTAVAGGALLLLAGRRIHRRLRSNGAERG